MKINWKYRLLLAAGFATLVACHHVNPLKSHTKQQSATFLVNASANVERRLKFDIKPDNNGYGYTECMEGKKNPEIVCEALYQGIIQFAKENHYPGFANLTMADLTEQTVFSSLIDDYYEIMIADYPTYYRVLS